MFPSSSNYKWVGTMNDCIIWSIHVMFQSFRTSSVAWLKLLVYTHWQNFELGTFHFDMLSMIMTGLGFGWLLQVTNLLPTTFYFKITQNSIYTLYNIHMSSYIRYTWQTLLVTHYLLYTHTYLHFITLEEHVGLKVTHWFINDVIVISSCTTQEEKFESKYKTDATINSITQHENLP